MNNLLARVSIQKDAEIKSAMKLIGKVSSKTLLVIDNENNLLGTITDGDIRRALIKQIALEAPVSEIMKKNPVTAMIGTSKEDLLKTMTEKQILAIPLINKLGKIEDIETIINITKVKKFNNSVLIMAGGFGKRLGYLTKDKPKPLLKVQDVPLLEKILQNLSLNGFNNIIISIHYKADMIKDHFGNGERLGVNIKYLNEESPLGTGGCLKLLTTDHINDLPLLVLNADLITSIDFMSFLEFHYKVY